MPREQTHSGHSGASDYIEAQQFLIELPHTKETCLRSLDKLNEMGPDTLEMWSFGCHEGNHTGYALVDADSVSEALEVVPSEERKQAKLHKLKKYTPEEIRSYHKM
jgi:hypothetical protein